MTSPWSWNISFSAMGFFSFFLNIVSWIVLNRYISYCSVNFLPTMIYRISFFSYIWYIGYRWVGKSDYVPMASFRVYNKYYFRYDTWNYLNLQNQLLVYKRRFKYRNIFNCLQFVNQLLSVPWFYIYIWFLKPSAIFCSMNLLIYRVVIYIESCK